MTLVHASIVTKPQWQKQCLAVSALILARRSAMENSCVVPHYQITVILPFDQSTILLLRSLGEQFVNKLLRFFIAHAINVVAIGREV